MPKPTSTASPASTNTSSPPPCAVCTPTAPRSPADASFNAVIATAVRCVLTDRATLTAHLRFPAEHWRRIRHTNLIERTFGETRRQVKSSEPTREPDRPVQNDGVDMTLAVV